MLKKILIAASVALVLLVAWILKTISDAGEFKTITPYFNGTTTLLNGFVGAEDITIDHETQLAYISTDDRFAILHGDQNRGGRLCIVSLQDSNAVSICGTIGIAKINPHGISFFKKKGAEYLYAVNHTDGKHSILLFQKAYNTLTRSVLPHHYGYSFKLLKTHEDTTFMLSPNDVLAVDTNKFYFTNDHGSRSKSGKMVEDYLQQKKSNVVYFDGKNYSIAADNIAYANGINMSRDGKELYVASTIGQNVLIYDRDIATGKLTLKDEVVLNTGVDNIELDEHGNLWVACHPQLLTFMQHTKDTSTYAPSQVFKLSKNAEGKFTAEEIFLSKGDDLSGSSVAAVSGNVMLIGSVMDNGILRCEMK